MGNLQSFEHQKRRPSPPSRSPFARPVHQASMEPLAVLPIQQQKGSHLSWNIANISLSPDPATLPSPASGFSDLMDRRPFIGAREPRPDGQLAPPPAFHHFVASVVQRRVRDEKHKQDLFPKKNTTGLPDTLKAGVERLSGFSLDDVHVHYNSSKPIQAGALAYTLGTDIHVGPGQERHLGHEAWHVVQQKQARVTPTIELDRIAINDDDRLEREADIMGARAAMDNTLARSKESDRR